MELRTGARCRAAPATERGLRGLDWLNFFVANFQTGFGPFISVYLTGAGWTQGAIGAALSAGTITAMASQVPAGALVDAVPSKRKAAAAAIAGIILSALLIALWPAFLPIIVAEALHSFASAVLGPAIAAITLVLVESAAFGERLGRNARYAAIGNADRRGADGRLRLLSDRSRRLFVRRNARDPRAGGTQVISGMPISPRDDPAPVHRYRRRRHPETENGPSSRIGDSSPLLPAPPYFISGTRRCCRLRPPRSPSGPATRRRW